MAKRLVPLSLLLIGILSLSSNLVFAAAGEMFVIVSVTYTDAAGKKQTDQFDAQNKSAQIPAKAVDNDIIINGTYAPGNALVTSTINVTVSNSSGAPSLDGKGGWTYSIAKNLLKTNTPYTISSNVGTTSDVAVVNNKTVMVAPKTLTIAAP
jgi:hypothetical protein